MQPRIDYEKQLYKNSEEREKDYGEGAETAQITPALAKIKRDHLGNMQFSKIFSISRVLNC